MSAKKQRAKTFLESLNFIEIVRTPAEREALDAEDRAARRRGRYYRGVARRIRHGIMNSDEIAMLRADKKHVTHMREKADNDA